MQPATLTIPPTREEDWWVARAREAVEKYLEADGAAVFVELQAVLCETPWLTNNLYPSFPVKWRIDPLHLRTAIRQLARMGVLHVERATLGGHPIEAYVHLPSLARYGRRTAVRELAASKRRLNRRLVHWTGKPALCGEVGESVVGATLQQLAGHPLYLPPGHRMGRVTHLLGRPIVVGGPLDAHAWCPRDVSDPNAGFVPFAVEVKNIRTSLYPWDHEVWDLLAKVGAFPDVLPVLVARRIHKTTFNMFKDLGALGVPFQDQWFSPAIAPAEFARVVNGLRLHNAKIVDPKAPSPLLSGWFSKTLPEHAGEALERWAIAAPLAARYARLRDPGLTGHERRRLWFDFGVLVKGSDLYDRGEWASRERLDEEDEDEYEEYDSDEEEGDEEE